MNAVTDSIEKVEIPEKKKVVVELPRLMTRKQFGELMEYRPSEALSLVRTHDELSVVIHALTRYDDFNPDWMEALLLKMSAKDYPYESKRSVIEWYLIAKSRPDLNTIRAFRFVFEHFGFSLAEDLLNKAVKRFRFLYWCNSHYRERMERILEEFACHPERQYSDYDWRRVERVLRRIVGARDYHLCSTIERILDLHKKKGMRIKEADAGDASGDEFLPDTIMTILKFAVRCLRHAEKEQNRDLAEFGIQLKKVANLQGNVLVNVTHPETVRFSGEEIPVTVSFQCTNQSDREAFTKQLSRVSIYCEIEGGYFPATPNGRLQEINGYLEVTMKSGTDWNYAFRFIPFGGLHRLWITLAYEGEDGSEFSLRRAYYFNVMEKKNAEAKVA